MHQVFGRKPDALLANTAPEEDERLAGEVPARRSEFIKGCCLADLDVPDMVHRLVLPSVIAPSPPVQVAQPYLAYSLHSGLQ